MTSRIVRSGVIGAALLAFASAASADGLLSLAGPSSHNSPYNPNITDAVNYLWDDGTVENGIGITGTTPFDIIWLNRFTVAPGGETITDIQAAIGSPLDTRNYNGLPMTVLLYSDPDGGSPANATVLASLNAVSANGNTGLLNNYDIPDTFVPTSEFFVAVLMRNLPGGGGFVASIDQTTPTQAGVSYAGFSVAPGAINENNLGALGANLGTIEGFGLPGNWVLRATAVPAPASIALLGLGGLAMARRRRA